MKKYQKFWFEGYEFKENQELGLAEIKLNYSLDKELFFTEKFTFPLNFNGRKGGLNMASKRALRALHIMCGISYYKTCLPVEIDGLNLEQNEADFWNKVYLRGLGEFFYQNKIDFRGLVNFKSGVDSAHEIPGEMVGSDSGELGFEYVNGAVEKKSLVAIGGGKDSIVTAELLKKAGLDFCLFSLREAAPIKATAEIIGKERLIVMRELDSKLFDLNNQGALNGHVPITAQISFLMVFCAAYYGFEQVIMSLEHSSNFGQMDYLGMDINHQYSKSEEFEGDFRKYLEEFIGGGIDYFSLLRQFNELKITQILSSLSNFDEYSPVFASCNRNFVINKAKPTQKWCGQCPKCAFVYLCLAPFLSLEKMVEIFGFDLLNDVSLTDLFAEILGLKNYKPFECVGTPEESLAAFYLISKKTDFQNSLLVKKFVNEWKKMAETKAGFLDWEKTTENQLKLQGGGFVPEELLKIIEQA